MSESVAFSVGFEDVAAVGEPPRQGASEALAAKDFPLFFEGQVGGHREAVVLIGPADNLKKQFGPGLGEGNISESIKDQECMSSG